MESEILAKVFRGETVESVHRGHLVVIQGNKHILASIGGAETVTFIRSAAKAFQAVPLIVSGAADHFGFGDEEIALACASHSGEPMHVEVVSRMLNKIGLNESDLKCGTHMPFDGTVSRDLLRSGKKPNQLQNNCSGKHAAMLAFAKHTGADIATYYEPSNPIQIEILETVAKFAQVSVENIAIGTDGCSAPNFALPISAMARSFANLVNPPSGLGDDVKDACTRIVSAMMQHPELIGGTERLDTLIMQAAPARLISKIGAEGVWLCGVLPNETHQRGLGIALKIEDGDDRRARPVVAVEILRQLRILSDADLKQLSPMPIQTRRGEIVGEIRPGIKIVSDE